MNWQEFIPILPVLAVIGMVLSAFFAAKSSTDFKAGLWMDFGILSFGVALVGVAVNFFEIF